MKSKRLVARAVVITLLATLAVFIALQLAFPRILEDRVRVAVGESLGKEGVVPEVDVKLQAFLPRLLRGKVDVLEIDVRGFLTNGLRIERLELEGEGLLFDLAALIDKHQLHLEAAQDLRAVLVVTEQDINEYLGGAGDLVRLSLGPGEVHLAGRLPLAQKELTVKLEGRIAVRPGNQVAFVPTGSVIGEYRVPRLMIEMLADRWSPVLSLGELPFELEVYEVDVLADRLNILARGGQGSV